jgi:hypothetical protein
MSYDPDRGPTPAAWLALPDDARMLEIASAHRRHSLGDEKKDRLHAVAHLLIENQLATNDPAVTRITLERLLSGGVWRHDAIHALSSVMMRFIVDAMQEKPFELSRYEDELAALEPRDWISGPSKKGPR